jgi:hypothetical protein
VVDEQILAAVVGSDEAIPLSALNHFTVPVAMDKTPPLHQERAEETHRAHPVLAQVVEPP